MSEENKIRDAADAVRGVVEAVPVYEDALQPAAKQVGKALETVAKTVHIALAPVSVLVWGYEQISEFVSTRVAEKLAEVPAERIKTPSPHVAGPALEALRYTGHEEDLRELYAALLATSLDSATAKNAHPAFVDIIRNMTPDEAKLMRLFAGGENLPTIDVRAVVKGGESYTDVLVNFSTAGERAGCSHPPLFPQYVDNLCRLGLLAIPEGVFLTAPGAYEPLENSEHLEPLRKRIEEAGRTIEFARKLVRRTPFGRQFCSACIESETKTARGGDSDE